MPRGGLSSRIDLPIPDVRKRDVVIGGILVLAVCLVVIEPEQLEALPTLCVFRRILGSQCPGCGMTRALSSLAQGELHAAISYNWKVVFVGPLLALLGIREVASAVSDRG